jgi:hypothetical protein
MINKIEEKKAHTVNCNIFFYYFIIHKSSRSEFYIYLAWPGYINIRRYIHNKSYYIGCVIICMQFFFVV